VVSRHAPGCLDTTGRRQAAGVSPTLEYALAHDGPAELAIYTVQGRRIRTLVHGVEAAGLHRVAWDGRDNDGRSAPAGVYYVRLLTNSERRSTTLIRVQ